MCPKGESKSHWWTIGCKRGTLKSEAPSVNLCPWAHNVTVTHLPTRPFGWATAENEAGELLSRNIIRRVEELEAGASKFGDDVDAKRYVATLKTRCLPIREVQERAGGSQEDPPPILTAQDDCIIAIAWEILDCSRSKTILGDTMEELIVLLHFAARYYSEVQTRATSELGIVCIFYP